MIPSRTQSRSSTGVLETIDPTKKGNRDAKYDHAPAEYFDLIPRRRRQPFRARAGAHRIPTHTTPVVSAASEITAPVIGESSMKIDRILHDATIGMLTAYAFIGLGAAVILIARQVAKLAGAA